MSTKTSLVEILHDEGYEPDLVWYINLALRGKDMRAVRTVESVESVNTDLLEALEDIVNEMAITNDNGSRVTAKIEWGYLIAARNAINKAREQI